MAEEDLNRLEAVMERAGELKRWDRPDFDEMVDNRFAHAAAE